METTTQSNNNMRVWLAVGLAGIFYIGGQYVASQPDQVQQEVEANREITVQGHGEAISQPDVARVTLAVASEIQTSSEQALSVTAEKMNNVIGAVKDKDIDEEDIKTTGLSVNPSYDYTNGRQTLRGYEARQEVTVTIRDLDVVGEVVADTTSLGVNQVGGVSFEIDDPSAVEMTAQKEAIKDARESAEELADELGVRLGKVKSFNANVSGAGKEPVFYRNEAALDTSSAIPAPEVPSGTQTVTADVSVTYELL